jgi:hypothetical protein
MGKSMDMAKLDNPELAQLIDDMKDQLLLILVHRLGGDITISVDEIDTLPVGKVMEMHFDIENRKFQFVVSEKH